MNLASIYDRISILLGYQPSLIGVSLNYPVGHIIKNIQVAPDHIRPFTYRSFKELLEIHKFKILETLGREIKNYPKSLYYTIIYLLDKYVISRSPSLSIGVIAICKNT